MIPERLCEPYLSLHKPALLVPELCLGRSINPYPPRSSSHPITFHPTMVLLTTFYSHGCEPESIVVNLVLSYRHGTSVPGQCSKSSNQHLFFRMIMPLLKVRLTLDPYPADFEACHTLG